MCERAESLGAFARLDCGLPRHLRELSLLMAARNWDAQYSWNAHVHQAIEAGIPEAAVNFNGAARKLGSSGSLVSRHVAELERQVGVRCGRPPWVSV